MSVLCVQIMVSISERKLRPDIPPLDELPGGAFPDLPQYITLLEACWHEDPDQRPSFETIITSLRAMLESSATSQKQQRIAKGPDARAQQPVGTTGPVVAGGPGPSTSPELTGTAPVEASAGELPSYRWLDQQKSAIMAGDDGASCCVKTRIASCAPFNTLSCHGRPAAMQC